MNAPALRSSVQCILLIRALEAECINKHYTLSLQNGLGSLWAGHWITTDTALDLVLHILSESQFHSHIIHTLSGGPINSTCFYSCLQVLKKSILCPWYHRHHWSCESSFLGKESPGATSESEPKPRWSLSPERWSILGPDAILPQGNKWYNLTNASLFSHRFQVLCQAPHSFPTPVIASIVLPK